jgi:transcription factor SFP1
MNNGFYNTTLNQEAQPIDISYQRQNSVFGQLHPQPQHSHVQQSININNSRNFRRDSVAHSQGVGGISWGSVTIGSWLKDEVLMQNQLNLQQQAHQHSMSPPMQSAYLPDLEANYCKDYSCCGQLLPTLHDLLKHYEESHISPTPPTHQPKPIQNFDTVSTTDVFIHNNINNQLSLQQQQQLRQQQLGGAAQRNQFGFTQSPFQQQHQQANQIRNSLSQQGQQQGQQQQPHINNNHHNLHNQQLPNGQFAMSQVQSPMDQFQQPGQHHSQSTQFPMQLNNDDAAMDLDDEQEEHFIDDPSRNLYVAQGSEKPFTCPVIGCNKTYKNQNGLKYHRIHGHQNQKLHPNPDGTYSIIDPNDGTGMEQDKPYRCEVCGKRYKNLNGLKYHRGHTTH